MAGNPRLASFTLAFVTVALAGACGSSTSDSTFRRGGDDASVFDGAGAETGPSYEGGIIGGDGATGEGGSDAPRTLDVEPSALQTVTVPLTKNAPTVLFQATLGGQPVSVGWGVDRGDVGSIAPGPSAQGTFVPTGTTGGLVNVIAGYGGQTLPRQVFVQLSGKQNGATAGEGGQVPNMVGQLGSGGGVGGVGGEGLGPPVTDPGTLGALKNPTSNGSAQGLAFLYPYDATVFPRGLLAPLLQWNWSIGNADGIQIVLETTSKSFSWTGTFGPPAILSVTGGKFIRMPIPQDIWTMATDTAGAATPSGKPDQLKVSLVVASGGVGYGPISETWSVAPAHLEGTVYYNSYGTHLVQNSNDNDHNGNQYGAAVLGIQSGATGPSVVAGTASPLGAGTGCRVCHTVSSGGTTLIAQHGDSYGATSAYDLTKGNAENPLAGAFNGLFGWAGLTADGKTALTNAGDLASGTPPSQLYDFPPTGGAPTPIPVTGIPTDLQAATPAFSPDSKHVAFDFLGGTIGTATGNGSQLVAMDYDSAHQAFSNFTVLATMTGGMRAGFPSFFPTNDAVAFHYQLVNSNHILNTWHGAQAQIWWSDLKTGTAQALWALNGLSPGGSASYLPTGPNNHGMGGSVNDTLLNYEPTVNPVSSGGYIWVIFTSRRLYGSVATTDPWQSDPRSYDYTQVANATCKKLWVAAIDLNAKPGTDPSHPAFYLPAQELLAGNSRGFWVLAPCKPNGQSCQSGDECCKGYCEPGGSDGGLVCSNKPPSATCSQPQEKCMSTGDCCDPNDSCVNGFCSVSQPQ